MIDKRNTFQFILLSISITIITTTILLTFFFFYSKKEIDANLISEVYNVKTTYNTLIKLSSENEFSTLEDLLKSIRISKPEHYNELFRNFKISDGRLFNSWGGEVVLNSSHNGDLKISYYGVPNGYKCVHFVSQQRSSNLDAVLFSNDNKEVEHNLNSLNNIFIAKKCNDQSVITFIKKNINL